MPDETSLCDAGRHRWDSPKAPRRRHQGSRPVAGCERETLRKSCGGRRGPRKSFVTGPGVPASTTGRASRIDAAKYVHSIHLENLSSSAGRRVKDKRDALAVDSELLGASNVENRKPATQQPRVVRDRHGSAQVLFERP